MKLSKNMAVALVIVKISRGVAAYRPMFLIKEVVCSEKYAGRR